MEQKFYKIRLTSGRVVGPLDLERVKLFIAKDQVTGLEMARLYPTGDWKDINTYPEIAEQLLLKLEGKLVTHDPREAQVLIEENSEPEIQKAGENQSKNAFTIEQPPQLPEQSQGEGAQVPPPKISSTQTGTPMLEATSMISKDTKTASDDATMVMQSSDEKTVIYNPQDIEKAIATPATSGKLELENPDLVDSTQSNPILANEKTAMLTVDRSGKKEENGGGFKSKKTFQLLLVLAAVAILIMMLDEDKKVVVTEGEFKVEIPAILPKSDPQKSEKLFVAGLQPYLLDTVEGYKKAAHAFSQAIANDQNNVRAICMLASSYMNLIDVLPNDENYFNVVTRLIEIERAKGLDLSETVIADVELYLTLGNPDAGFNRVVEFSKNHQWGPDMLYYLALSLFHKGQTAEALQQLYKIDMKQFPSAKVPYLYGRIFEKNENQDEAIKAYGAALGMSAGHLKSRIRLADLYSRKDNLPEASKHVDFVIQRASQVSMKELAQAYYLRGRMHEAARRTPEALADLELALKNDSENEDILLEYYTIKARSGAQVKDAQSKAKMYSFMASGERALKEGKLDEAAGHYVAARDADYNDPAPPMRLAEVFRRKGDMQSVKINLEKAVKLAPKRADIYPKYIKALIDMYEFDDAVKAMTVYKELNGAISTVDKLQGDLYMRQNKLREALAYFKHAIAVSNVDSGVYISYAQLLFRGGDFRGSAFYFGLSQRFDPFNSEATVGIGKSLSELESTEKGVEYIQTALQNSPHKAALLNGIAEIYLKKGDYASAMKFAENALVADPSFSLSNKTKGDIFAAQDKRKEAHDAYLTYTNLAPLDPSGHIERYKLYLKKTEKGDFDLKAAKAEIEKVIKQYPKYPGAYYMLGELFNEGMNYDSALQAAQIEIQNNPTQLDAYVLAGRALMQKQDYANALTLLNKAMKYNPTYVPLLLNAGIANHQTKSYAAAQSLFERVLQLDVGNAEAHKRLSLLFNDLGNADRRRQHCKAYLDLYPDAPDRAQVERSLCN